MKRWAIFLAVFLFGFQVLNPVLASELTDDYFDIATNYFNSNNFAKSLEYLDLIIQFEPDNIAAQTLRNKLSPPPAIITQPIDETAKMLAVTPNPENLVILEVPKADVEKMASSSGSCYVKQRKLLDLKREVWFNKNDYLAYFHLG